MVDENKVPIYSVPGMSKIRLCGDLWFQEGSRTVCSVKTKRESQWNVEDGLKLTAISTLDLKNATDDAVAPVRIPPAYPPPIHYNPEPN